jgi:cell division protein ZapB
MTTPQGTKQPAEPKKDNSKKGLIIGFIIILLLINGIQFYLGWQDKKEIKEKIVYIAQKEDENKALLSTRDSLLTELKNRYEEITQLGGDTAKLGEIIRSLELDKRRLANSATSAIKAKAALQRQIDEMKLVNRDYEAEVERYKKLSEEQQVEITSLKSNIQAKVDSLNIIAATKDELARQIDLAKILRAENIKISVLDKKDKEKVDDAYKAKKIDRVKVVFNFADNKVAQIETKTVYLRFLGPDGGIINNKESGSGNFTTAEGIELPYTVKQDILFDNRQQPITFIYLKGYEYTPGTYKVELYAEGYPIGNASLLVKK